MFAIIIQPQRQSIPTEFARFYALRSRSQPRTAQDQMYRLVEPSLVARCCRVLKNEFLIFVVCSSITKTNTSIKTTRIGRARNLETERRRRRRQQTWRVGAR